LAQRWARCPSDQSPRDLFSCGGWRQGANLFTFR